MTGLHLLIHPVDESGNVAVDVLDRCVRELDVLQVKVQQETLMIRHPTAGHLLSWAGLCPRNDESAGKRHSTRLRKGDLWLKTLLVQCAWAARRKKGSYFNAQFLRLRGRRGPKKAACAVAASLLTTIYHMLKDGTQFHDLGADHFDRRSKDLRAKRLVAQLANLGFNAKLTPLARAA